MASPDWLALPRDDRQDDIQTSATKARKQAKVGMFAKVKSGAGTDAWPGTPLQ